MAFAGTFDTWFRGAPFLLDGSGGFSVWFRGAPAISPTVVSGLEFLQTSATPIYVCPQLLRALVLKVILVNTDAAQRKVNLFLRALGGVPRRLTPVDTRMPAGYQLTTDSEYALATGDQVEGTADVSDVVSAFVSKIEAAA